MENKTKFINILKDLIQKHGQEIIKNPAKIESFLSDLTPDTLRENYLITLSIKSGLTTALFFNENKEIESTSAINDAKSILCNQFSIKDDALMWIENIWEEIHFFQNPPKMSHTELQRILQENIDLKKKIQSLQEEMDRLKKHPILPQDESKSIQEEYPCQKKKNDLLQEELNRLHSLWGVWSVKKKTH